MTYKFDYIPVEQAKIPLTAESISKAVQDYYTQQQMQSQMKSDAVNRMSQMAGIGERSQTLESNLKAQDLQNAFIQQQTENLKNKPAFTPTGGVGQIYEQERIKKEFGENSPVYQSVKKYQELQNALIQSQIARNLRENKNGAGNLTPVQKMMNAADLAGKGIDPNTNQPYQDPEKQKKDFDTYNSAVRKMTIPPSAIENASRAQVLDTALNSINFDAISPYSGPLGKLKLAADASASQFKKVPAYEKYSQAVTSASSAADQLRKFWGSSISPTQKDYLEFLTNPSGWMTSPSVATAKFNAMKKLLKAESDIYKEAGGIHNEAPENNKKDSLSGDVYLDDFIRGKY